MSSISPEILIVEDDEAIRESLADMLRDEGFTVASAENGLEALGYLESHGAPCVIVLDLMMPVMSGPQFREKQLADPRFASIPVIVMSAADLGSITAAQLHANGFFPKPPDVDAMVATLTRFC